jgi:hypothetical protein
MGAVMSQAERRDPTLVWIDAAEAVIVRLRGSEAAIERVESEVPAHHRATGHVRHDPSMRHGGGGGSPQTADEPHRLEHLKRFVAEIEGRLAASEELLIIGPGTVHERLARRVMATDEHRGRDREVSCEVSPRLTDRQLVARLRRLAGAVPRRRKVGPYQPHRAGTRWSRDGAQGSPAEA